MSTTECDSRIYDATTVESSNYTQESGSQSRHNSQQLLMLPAPLSVNRPSPSRLSRTSEDVGGPDSSCQQSTNSPQSADDQYGYDTPDDSPSIPRYTSPTSTEPSNFDGSPIRSVTSTRTVTVSVCKRSGTVIARPHWDFYPDPPMRGAHASGSTSTDNSRPETETKDDGDGSRSSPDTTG